MKRTGATVLITFGVLTIAVSLVAGTAAHAQMAGGDVSNSQRTSTTDPQNQQGSSSATSQQQTSQPPAGSGSAFGGQLISPVNISGTQGSAATQQDALVARQALNGTDGLLNLPTQTIKPPAQPGEYENWLRQITGRKLKRYGSDLMVAPARDFSIPANATVPPDYALNIGDVVSISLTGSVEGSANFEIDRDGKIYLPNIGSVSLVGVRFRDLKERIATAIGLKYRGYEVSVSMARLRGIRVFVTGFANNPGAYNANSLSTLVNAVLASGGPSAGGSFRSIKLYRNGKLVSDYDLYQLLRKGDRSRDPILQNEDVLFIPPVGEQVAVIGSVNEEAIYEALPGESLEDMLDLAGGVTNLADRSRLILYRLGDRDTVGSRQFEPAQARLEPAQTGDVIQILPQGSLVRPLERQQAIVRIEGEVNRPGNYFVPPGTPLSAVIDMAGGLTARAFVFGTEFTRESVRAQQRKSFLEAIDQMETVLAAAPLNGDHTIDAGERQTQLNAVQTFLDKLRKREPDGRLVLDLTPAMRSLPGDILLENNDRIVIPPQVNTIGVFGAVYRPASFLLDSSQKPRVRDFVERAGGPIRGADRTNIFVVRANGSVLTTKRGALGAQVVAGDTVFVPVKTQSSSLFAKIRDISATLFQFGVTAAAISAVM
jgi:protein involved in polysaccharide export with SLBB domain